MKIVHKVLLPLLLIQILAFFNACDSDEDIEIEQAVKDALYARYPDASCLEWEVIDGYMVGEFRSGGFYCKAWFSIDGGWYMTETEDLVYSRDLPEEVRSTVEKTGYNTKNISSIYKVDFPDIETRYIIKFDNNRSDLYAIFRKSGDLIKEVNDDWDNKPIVIPEEILSFIENEYDGEAIIYDADITSEFTNINIVYEKKLRVVCFDSALSWVGTYWDIPAKEVISPVILSTLYRITGRKDDGDIRYQLEYNNNMLKSAGHPDYNMPDAIYSAKMLIYTFIFTNSADTVFINDKLEQIPNEKIEIRF